MAQTEGPVFNPQVHSLPKQYQMKAALHPTPWGESICFY